MGNVCCSGKNELHSRGKIERRPFQKTSSGDRRSTYTPNMKNFKNLKWIDCELKNTGSKDPQAICRK